MLKLNDIWRNVDHEIGFFTKETFDDIPPVPGVYAWYYPLRITTYSYKDFMNEVHAIYNYDAKKNRSISDKAEIDFTWSLMNTKVWVTYKYPDSDKMRTIWKLIQSNAEMFNHVRKIVMRASLLMPPLYVGKTNNLRVRCGQHLCGNEDKNHFNRRYTNYASKLKLSANTVADLLFISIKTGYATEKKNETVNDDDIEYVVEEILKYLAKPMYSCR